MYSDYWLNNDKHRNQVKNESRDDFPDEFLSIKSLPLPQLLSLLIETKAPFFYGNDESGSLTDNPSRSFLIDEQNLGSPNQTSNQSKFNNSSETKNLDLDDMYENFMWNKFARYYNSKESSDGTNSKKDDLLKLFQWSIQPAHPAIFDKKVSDKIESGDIK